MNNLRSRFRMLSQACCAICLLAAVSPALAQVAAPPRPAENDQSQSENSSQDGGGLKTLAIVAAEPYNALIKDIQYLGTLSGRPETSQMVEGGIAFFTQGKGLEAIDRTKPWGVIVQTDGAQLLPVGCLPVKKLADLLDVVAGYGIDIKDVGDGVKELARAEGRPLYLKEADGWAFIAPSPAVLANLPESPQVILSALVEEYDLAASFSIQNVPEMYRQFAIQAMQAGMQQGMQQKAEESDEAFKLRQQLAQGQMVQVQRAIEELDSFTIGWAVDEQQQHARLDVTVRAVPGSGMAKEIAAAAEATTNFAGFYQPDAAATLLMASQSDPQQQNVAQLESALESARQQFNKGIDENENIPNAMRDDFKAAANDFFEAFLTTAKAGQMDAGLALHLAPDSLTLVAGALVKDPEKFESGLKKLDAAAKRSPEFSGIQWNAANYAGVTFHTLTVPVPSEHAGPHKLLGDKMEVAFGIGPEAVYLAIGQDNLEAVKKAIDASAAQRGKHVSPFELAISLGPVADVMAAQADEGPQKDVARAVAEMIRTEAPQKDHLRLMGRTIPDGLRYRFEAEEGVLKALGKVAAERQRQAQQADQ